MVDLFFAGYQADDKAAQEFMEPTTNLALKYFSKSQKKERKSSRC